MLLILKQVLMSKIEFLIRMNMLCLALNVFCDILTEFTFKT